MIKAVDRKKLKTTEDLVEDIAQLDWDIDQPVWMASRVMLNKWKAKRNKLLDEVYRQWDLTNSEECV